MLTRSSNVANLILGTFFKYHAASSFYYEIDTPSWEALFLIKVLFNECDMCN